jgi:short-subunit dehydrogenase
MAVYGATKAFVLSFTEALWGELGGTGVKALALCPGATRTEFFDVVGDEASFGPSQSPEQVVETALSELDRRTSRPSVISGRANTLVALLPRLTSRRLTIKITRRALSGPR